MSDKPMTFEEWHDGLCCQSCADNCPHKEWEKKAWAARQSEIDDLRHQQSQMAKELEEARAELAALESQLKEAIDSLDEVVNAEPSMKGLCECEMCVKAKGVISAYRMSAPTPPTGGGE